MSPFPLVIFLTLAAGPDRATPPGCRTDYDSCHEDCTIEYGGVTTKYRQLTQCVDKCLSEQDDCTTRHYSLRDAQMDEPPSRGRPKSSGGSDEFGDTSTAAAATPRDGARRGVYRASDEEAPANPEPAEPREAVRAPAPEPVRTPAQPVRAPAPEPEPAPRPAAPAARAAEPEPAPAPSPARSRTTTPVSSNHDEDIPVFGADASKDDAEEAPAPKPKPAPSPSAPLRPTPPPEPKKRDISDWDPNGK